MGSLILFLLPLVASEIQGRVQFPEGNENDSKVNFYGFTFSDTDLYL